VKSKAWSAQFGSWQLSREDFMSEVHSFHDRLMKQMAERVSQIAAGGLKKKVHIDVAGLRREQLARSQPLASILIEPAHATDWSLVITAVQTLETSHG
jgi:hypothetical protein